MDRVAEYREIIKRVLADYAQYKPSIGEIDVELVLDEVNDHYEMLYIGWEGPKRVHGTVIHLDIRDKKIWLHHDGTESGVANDLIAAGIPRSDIILGWQEPELRELLQHTPLS